jgi:hypothetical protein
LRVFRLAAKPRSDKGDLQGEVVINMKQDRAGLAIDSIVE